MGRKIVIVVPFRNKWQTQRAHFTGPHDYLQFLDVLQEATVKWNLRIAAYLMLTHYYLLVQTPQANISRGMRHIHGVYTQSFNCLHVCEGPLFRGPV